MALKLTKEQQLIDNAIRRINRQITQAARIFGTQSRLYQQYETLLHGYTESGKRRKVEAPTQAGLVRENKAGIPQIQRSRKALEMIRTGAAANAIMQLQRMQTVKQAKAATVAAYEKRTGQKVKGASAVMAAIKSEVESYEKTQGRLSNALAEMYRIEKERGIKFKSHDDIKAMSKGRWTSQETLDEMINLAEQTVNAENAAIVSEFDRLAGY